MRQWILGVAGLGAALVFGGMSARAGIVMTAVEIGGDVVISGGGTANLAGLTFDGENSFLGGGIVPSSADLLVNSGDGLEGLADVDVYTGLTGPSGFGTGGASLASDSTGDVFGLSSTFGPLSLIVPLDYVSNTILSGSITFANATFASLGIDPLNGPYVWSWGAGGDADTFVLQFETAVVPEPSSLTLAGIGVGLALWTARRRRAATA